MMTQNLSMLNSLENASQLLAVLSASLENSDEHAGRFYQVGLIAKEVRQAIALLSRPGNDFIPAALVD